MKSTFAVKNKGSRREFETPSIELTRFPDMAEKGKEGDKDSFRPILDHLHFKLPSVLKQLAQEQDGKGKDSAKLKRAQEVYRIVKPWLDSAFLVKDLLSFGTSIATAFPS